MSLLSWLKKNTARDDAWITVHPNAGGKGSPVLLDDEGYIKGGMGGKFTGQRIDLMPRKRGYGVPTSENDPLNKSTPGFLRTSRYTLRSPQGIGNASPQKAPFTRVETEASKELAESNISYNEVQPKTEEPDEHDIIKSISGGDKTEGSCASVALAYIGQNLGFDVKDFRGGESREKFANQAFLHRVLEDSGAKISMNRTNRTSPPTSTVDLAKKMMAKMKVNKPYLLCAGSHASMIKKGADGMYSYLELQNPDPMRNGWNLMTVDGVDTDPTYYLVDRFGCSRHPGKHVHVVSLTDVSTIKKDRFGTCLGYLNTADSEQEKGDDGEVK